MLRTIMLAASLGLLAGHAACLFSGRTPPLPDWAAGVLFGAGLALSTAVSPKPPTRGAGA